MSKRDQRKDWEKPRLPVAARRCSLRFARWQHRRLIRIAQQYGLPIYRQDTVERIVEKIAINARIMDTIDPQQWSGSMISEFIHAHRDALTHRIAQNILDEDRHTHCLSMLPLAECENPQHYLNLADTALDAILSYDSELLARTEMSRKR